MLMGGSTHEGEEELLLSVWQRLREAHPGLRLVLAPRYVDRAARVQSLAQARGVEAGRRTTGPAGAPVMVLDTIGEWPGRTGWRPWWWSAGASPRAAARTSSSPPRRGARCSSARGWTTSGTASRCCSAAAASRSADAEQLHRVLSELLGRPDVLANLGNLAAQSVRQVSGASQRNVDLVARLLLGAGARPTPRRAGSVG